MQVYKNNVAGLEDALVSMPLLTMGEDAYWANNQITATGTPAKVQAKVGPAKGKDTATTLGPWLVTKDEIAAYRKDTGYDLTMTVAVNGREYGRDQWSNAHWSFAEMIAYASRGTWVSTGDVLGSGTCGYGCLAELRVYDEQKHPWLKPGDEVVFEVERLGRIANRVVPGAELIRLRA